MLAAQDSCAKSIHQWTQFNNFMILWLQISWSRKSMFRLKAQHASGHFLMMTRIRRIRKIFLTSLKENKMKLLNQLLTSRNNRIQVTTFFSKRLLQTQRTKKDHNPKKLRLKQQFHFQNPFSSHILSIKKSS